MASFSVVQSVDNMVTLDKLFECIVKKSQKKPNRLFKGRFSLQLLFLNIILIQKSRILNL